MAKFKYELGQRVIVERYGAGSIDALPYNSESNTYGVWLDKPEVIETSHGTVLNQLVAVSERYISSVN